jgi:hypothetical protein
MLIQWSDIATVGVLVALLLRLGTPTVIDVSETEEPVVPPTETKTRRQRIRERFGLPWPKTSVSGPFFGDDFLLVNRTALRWFIYLDWHALDLLQPFEIRTVQRGPTVRVSVRAMDDSETSSTISVNLVPDARGVEVLDISGGENFFDLRLLSGTMDNQPIHPDSTPIAELDLTSETKNALTAAGMLTVGDLRRAEPDTLLDVANAVPRARHEVFRLMTMRRNGL